MESFPQDLPYAFRMLWKAPAFSAVVILTLALGIGANTVVFSVVSTLFLQPLPYPDSNHLVSIWNRDASGQHLNTAPPDFDFFRSENRTLDNVTAYFGSDSNLSGAGRPLKLHGLGVASNFFSVLGVPPSLGRDFLPSEEKWGSHREVILSNGLWHQVFGADPAVLGRIVELDGEPFVVVGVLPANFWFLDSKAQIFKPMSFAPNDNLDSRNNHFLTMLGRLHSNVQLSAARADLDRLAERLAEQYPENKGVRIDVTTLQERIVGNLRPIVLLLMSAVALVLLIACGNLANLVVARAIARENEAVVRVTLGASFSRLLRQFLTENMLLSVLGGTVGLLLAIGGIRFVHLISSNTLPRASQVRLDMRVLIFAFGASLLTAALFTTIPLFHVVRLNVNDALKGAGRGLAGGRHPFRNLLVVVQIAFSLMLLVGAGLVLRSLLLIRRIDVGFDPSNLITLQMDLPESRYLDSDLLSHFSPAATAKASRFLGDVGDHIRHLPGVVAVGSVSNLPIDGGSWGKNVVLYDRPLPSTMEQLPPIEYRTVSGDYFRALRIRLISGRFLSDNDDLRSPLVAVVSQEFVRRYWNGEMAIGKDISVNPPKSLIPPGSLPPGYPDPQRFNVVGVVGDVAYDAVGKEPVPVVYVPYAQGSEGSTTQFLSICTDRDPASLVSAVREQVWQVDPDLPLGEAQTGEDLVADSIGRPKLEASVLGTFASVGMLLAGIGLYGVISYSVVRRTRETGLRIALGAQPADVSRLFAKEGMILVSLGLALGCGAMLLLRGVMSSLLYGITATDPMVFATVVLLLSLTSIVAIYFPVRRATKISPMTALREQ